MVDRMAETEQIVWKSEARIHADPEKAVELFEKIRRENDGELPPAAVLEAAKPLNSPIHDEFEWDDAKAALIQRLDRAQYLIRMLVVIKTYDPVPMRLY